jgi:hypothetical protein
VTVPLSRVITGALTCHEPTSRIKSSSPSSPDWHLVHGTYYLCC